ncbi:dCTP deaminase [Rhodococcus ruber]|uniref:dCTP deaminase n=1 Tax=Rhodococcus ruber TaxID=1830 RepID=UPI001EEF3E2C|nr:dCTP deaminase [Rhodococcus ruber]MCF8785252.1 dCTP deaminase [Rhodococcus ruber]
MILSGHEIFRAVENGDIVVAPFNASQLGTNSYDFRLGPTLLQYREPSVDVRVNNPTNELTIGPEGIILRAGEFYLGHTLEVMGSNRYVPIIKGKSSIARLGLFIHATADLIDIGSINQWTLQLVPTIDVKLYPGMKIGQVTFWTVAGDIQLYQGKYAGSRGPVASRGYLDFITDQT